MTDYNSYHDKYDALNAANQDELAEYIIEQNPEWLEQMSNIEYFTTLASIAQGGCASGAYMPAVTYHSAKMALFCELGESMVEYAVDFLAEIDSLDQVAIQLKDGVQYMAAYLASVAVEAWVYEVEQDVLDKIDELLAEQAEAVYYCVALDLLYNVNNRHANDPDQIAKMDTFAFDLNLDEPIFSAELIDKLENAEIVAFSAISDQGCKYTVTSNTTMTIQDILAYIDEENGITLAKEYT